MKRTLEPHELIERSIIKKFRKTIWNPFTPSVSISSFSRATGSPCVFLAARTPC